jgi:hypothetical protein
VIPDAEVVSALVYSQPSAGLHRDIKRWLGLAWWIPAIGLFAILCGFGAVRLHDMKSRH